MIVQFKVPQIDKYDFSQIDLDGAPVFFAHRYNLEDLCGKVVHISERRKTVNIEFVKFHPLYNILKKTNFMLKLDIVYSEQLSEQPRLAEAFVVYHEYGSNNF